MKFTQIRSDTMQNIQMNAGIIASDFTVGTGTIDEDDILGATTGGIQFQAAPEFTDFGEDIDNCPKNTKELKQITSWEATMSGTFVAINADTAKILTAAADLASNKITPRNELKSTDFMDLWFIGDYSDVNTGTNAGYIAIKLINALSTGGFQLQTTDKGKGQFAFTFTGHYSIDAQDTVPFEIYVKEGTA